MTLTAAEAQEVAALMEQHFGDETLRDLFLEAARDTDQPDEYREAMNEAAFLAAVEAAKN